MKDKWLLGNPLSSTFCVEERARERRENLATI